MAHAFKFQLNFANNQMHFGRSPKILRCFNGTEIALFLNIPFFSSATPHNLALYIKDWKLLVFAILLSTNVLSPFCF